MDILKLQGKPNVILNLFKIRLNNQNIFLLILTTQFLTKNFVILKKKETEIFICIFQ